ncbi:hypothetical protein FRC05_001921 [Tulasnella sp. 425]|nr:hypothetical protein FRC05_001921 [Tulasnella sp. 425]
MKAPPGLAGRRMRPVALYESSKVLQASTVFPRKKPGFSLNIVTPSNDSSGKSATIQPHLRALRWAGGRVMRSVQPKLQEASNTYGAKEKEIFSNLGKVIFNPMNRSKCTQVLESCRNDVRNSLASLPHHWNYKPETEEDHLEAASTSQNKGSTPLVGDVPSAVPAEEQTDDQTKPAPQVAAPQSPIPVTSPSPDEEQAVPDDKVKGPSKRRDWLGGVKTTFTIVEGISGTIPVVGTYVGAAAKVGAAIVEIVQIMDSNEETVDALGSNARQLSKILEHFKKGSVDPRNDDLTTLINDLQGFASFLLSGRLHMDTNNRRPFRELRRIQHKIEDLNNSGVLQKAFSAKDRAEVLKGYQETIRTTSEQLQVREPSFITPALVNLFATLNTTTLITELYDKGVREEQRRLLDRLGDANYGARGDAIEDVICLEGTRVRTLERISAWIRDTSTSKNVLWIRGMAGRGKSTIASTVAHQWKYQAASAIFHFRRGQNELDKRLVCALARQLGSNNLVPEVKDSILQSVQENEDIGQDRLRDQFQALFTRSLGRLQNTSLPILFIVDALDECQDVNYAVNFVKLIEQFIQSLPVNVKFLLTTRPETPLIRALEPREWHAEDLDSMENVDDDIAQFLRRGFLRVRKEYDLEQDWPPHDDMQAIVRMSQGLFQWAHTAIEYMMEGSPQNRLRELLDLPSICDGMDELYLQILSKAFKKAKKHPAREDLFLRTLGTLVVAPYPISFDILTFIYADQNVFQNESPDNIIRYLRQEVLVDLGSLIHIPRSSTDLIRLVHTSVRDLLVDKERCGGEPYSVDPTLYHHYLASKCLQLMERDLKTNICRLSDLSKANSDLDVQDLVQRHVPKGLEYCCRSWSIHLIASRSESESGCWGVSSTEIKSFSEKKLLGWLEVMSLIGETRGSVKVAKQMHLWLRCSAHLCFSIAILPLEDNPLEMLRTAWSSSLWSKHIGTGVVAVTFSPDGEMIASGAMDSTIQMWDAETGAPIGEPLIGHNNSVRCISFSPNGKFLASGSDDKTIRLWETETGAPVGEPLIGHDDSVWSISFSPNGKILASGSDDKTIQLWDTETGAPIGEPLRGHDHTVWSISFSPNGKILASGSQDKTIRLWDTETGAPIGEPLRGHDDSVLSISFSPNGKILASGSDDETIQLWDTETGAPIGERLKGHDHSIMSISFSPKGKILASGSKDKTIRLWDTETGAPIGEPLKGHDHSVWSISFSPNGKVIASGSWDETIRLWNAETGAPIGEPLRGHNDSVWSVSFSPNGKIIASGSWDKTIQLWDAETGAPIREPLRGHDSGVLSISFSPNGNILASGSADETIRLWDVETGALIGEPLRGHDNCVLSISFSPNGKILASGSDDETIRLWNAETGAPIGEPLRGHNQSVWSISFSSNGKILASGSSDKTVRLWDAESRAPIGEPLRGHDDSVLSISFSPNGKILASGSDDETIRLWDTKTGAPVGEPLRGHKHSILTISFSSNGKILASGSSDNTIRLWDAETRAPIGEPLRGHDKRVMSISFSPSGKILASGSSDRRIRLWDVETGIPIGEPLGGHDSDVLSISFSPSGKIFASGSSDKTIRLWDAETGALIGEPLIVS